MRKILHSALLLCLAAPLVAEDVTPYSVGFALTSAQGDLRDLTQKGLGYAFELGWRLPWSEAGLSYSVHADFLRSYRDDKASSAAEGKYAAVGFNLRYELGQSGFAIHTGPMLGQWDFLYPDKNVIPDAASWKMGWRVGATYQVTPRSAVFADYTWSEFATMVDPNYLGGVSRSINPSYLRFGYSYTF